jgi:hypothetical protein
MSDVSVYVSNVPKGTIVMWAGTTAGNCDATGLGTGVLSGWAICNGSNGTPNLVGSVPYGAAAQTRGAYPTGGAASTTLTPQQMPEMYASIAHGHGNSFSVSDSGHMHQVDLPTTNISGTQYESNSMSDGSDRGLWTGSAQNQNPTTLASANLTVAGSVSDYSGSITLGQPSPTPVPTMPPYVTIVFIMKV